MKTENLLLLGALGVGAYLLLSKPATATVTNNMQSGQSTGQEAPPPKKDQGVTPADIKAVNEGYENRTLQRTSQTVARNVTYTTPDAIQRSGNVVQLAIGNPVAISATPAVRDAQGKTAIDRLIEKNVAASKAKTIK
jgi:hypothetical protein